LQSKGKWRTYLCRRRSRRRWRRCAELPKLPSRLLCFYSSCTSPLVLLFFALIASLVLPVSLPLFARSQFACVFFFICCSGNGGAGVSGDKAADAWEGIVLLLELEEARVASCWCMLTVHGSGWVATNLDDTGFVRCKSFRAPASNRSLCFSKQKPWSLETQQIFRVRRIACQCSSWFWFGGRRGRD